ncbi:hypothetical protein SODALDRAFT_326034 [Sodiomyces alkalinus F11]|uniref:polynucleotide adenylyltransferase n=1 Tax=Sodiomyces alkalinus (strain CBS 110278 / VKM F-3762 / F11) TaxID=1314773 RepID=A0A3N2Q574_SODAK|nr:hypothetical protein SODALDRAFT_326034 [Sodiomyces alkalinus F11]ROT41847.1 hypothetical protein SODALDRAFT_326034 [Sodiomyces alkalinus F11]
MTGRHTDPYGRGHGLGHGHPRPPPGIPAPTPDLEYRLRNLIISNAAPAEASTQSTQSTHSFADQSPAPVSLPIPFSVPAATSGAVPSPAYQGQGTLPAPASPGDVLGPQSAHTPSKASRKRPNQAQRRQMSSQLLIPIDHRPTQPWTSRRPGSHGGHGGHGSHGSYGSHPQSRGQGQALLSQSPRAPYSHPTAHSDHSAPANSWINSGRHQQQHHQYDQAQRQGAPQAPHHPHPMNRHPTNRHPMNPHPIPSMPPGLSGDMPASSFPRRSHHANVYEPHNVNTRPEQLEAQSAFLEHLCHTILRDAEIDRDDIIEKEAFRFRIEDICRKAIAEHEEQTHRKLGFPHASVSLKCFGSLSSGFATKASDMDLGLLSPCSQPQPDDPASEIPRLIEKAFLTHGLGARLLTRTRVPIIKVCEKPNEGLLRDLLEARETWEAGIDPSLDDHDGDQLELEASTETQRGGDEPPASTVATVATMAANSSSATAEEEAETSIITSSLEGSASFKLRQSEGQSLAAYHITAKRVLRRLQGRDLTLSNYREFSRDEFELLNRVCAAFIQGLRDPVLKARLQTYPSISSLALRPSASDAGHDGRHSLLGVFSQAEGEKLVMLWENRGTLEKNSDQEKMAEGTVKSWKLTQSRDTFAIDPLLFTKQVQIHLEKLKKINSIQLLTLQQDQGESASEYYHRAARIVAGLKPSDFLDSGSFRELVVHHYVTGIWSHELRSDIDGFVKNYDEPPALDTVGRRHKSLQLAMELEKAIEKDLYGEPPLVEHIQRYISLLRSPMELRSSPDGRVGYVVPIADWSLLDLIQNIPDPSKMAPNQPRDRYRDKLEFPETGAGVQCDINFSAHLALHNTLLLRCYSHTDPRVRPLVLFVKHWAKMRGVNTPYRGTLSSYGYVLMMLHYLVNVVQPFVCPNLQQLGPPPPPSSLRDDDPDHPARADETLWCRGHYVGFWRDEAEIQRLASLGQLNGNRDSVGKLLRGFFEYYAQTGHMTTYPGVRGFDWGRDVLSLRTPGGLLSKQAKGWTGAKTVVEIRNNGESPAAATSTAAGPLQSASASAPTAAGPHGHPNQHPAGVDVKEIRLRYLFAIEDPFELDHNVARTVTHNGIVSIRDEFRRAWRIIKAAGNPEAVAQGRVSNPGELLQDVNEVQMKDDRANFLRLLSDIHGLDGTPVGAV